MLLIGGATEIVVYSSIARMEPLSVSEMQIHPMSAPPATKWSIHGGSATRGCEFGWVFSVWGVNLGGCSC